MISVDAALEEIFKLAAPLKGETVSLRNAAGRVLLKPTTALRDQPPFAASSMDGYAVREDEVHPGAEFRVIGTSAAGHGFEGKIDKGEAARIFTGAPVPEGADRVIIQEDVTEDDDHIRLNDQYDTATYIRPKGTDFTKGQKFDAARVLRASDIALLAAMNVAEVEVTRKPVVALISTGDELVMPGENPGADQIIASNALGLAALIDEIGASARLLPIARDQEWALDQAFGLAQDADVIVTIGGASVGDHDLVAPVAERRGMERAFYKIAMRPGKPLMAGKLGDAVMLGLPGNPVSSMVCGHVFLKPLLLAMLGSPATATPRHTAPLARDIPENGIREHYMRATLEDGKLSVFERQDSALLSVLSRANALVVRPVGDPARRAGDLVEYISI